MWPSIKDLAGVNGKVLMVKQFKAQFDIPFYFISACGGKKVAPVLWAIKQGGRAGQESREVISKKRKRKKSVLSSTHMMNKCLIAFSFFVSAPWTNHSSDSAFFGGKGDNNILSFLELINTPFLSSSRARLLI